MTTSTKCRAKNPAACTDPNCPEKKYQQAVAAAQNSSKALYRKSGKSLDLGTVSSEGYWHIARLTKNFHELMQPTITPEARHEAQAIIRLEDKGGIDMGEASNEVYNYAEELSKSIRAIVNVGK